MTSSPTNRMETADDSNSNSLDMFDVYHNKNSVDGCSSKAENVSDNTEGKEETSSRTSRKINFQSIPRVPKVAVQEKIIICIENSQNEGLGYKFRDLSENSQEPSTLKIRNEALKIMMVNKLAIAKDTEFAIISVMPGKVKWLTLLTSDLNKLSKSLKEDRNVFSVESKSFEITNIFSDVLMKINIPENDNITIVPPNYIIRLILVYSSSFLVPEVNTKDPSYLKFVMSPYCFLDVFYLHEKPSDFNNVKRIYQEFGKIVSPSSYLLETSRDVTNVFNNAAKLLAHPNQRVVEAMWDF